MAIVCALYCGTGSTTRSSKMERGYRGRNLATFRRFCNIVCDHDPEWSGGARCSMRVNEPVTVSVQLPVKFGLRFSKNASMASLESCVALARSHWSVSMCMIAGSSAPEIALMLRLIICTEMGGRLAN
jgi:hypothetical protein